MAKFQFIPFPILLTLALPACAPQVTEIPVIPKVPTTLPAPTPASRSLTVCLGEEPTITTQN